MTLDSFTQKQHSSPNTVQASHVQQLLNLEPFYFVGRLSAVEEIQGCCSYDQEPGKFLKISCKQACEVIITGVQKSVKNELTQGLNAFLTPEEGWEAITYCFSNSGVGI